MTPQQQAALLADFIQWTGGFYPDECPHEEISAYVRTAMPALPGVTAADAIDYLTNYGD